MKVILLQDVEDLGKKYEVKEVKPGYGRNFLLPNHMAKAATKEAMAWLESQKETIEAEVANDLKQSQELASKLDGAEVTISVKVGDKDQLFESIDTAKIAKELKEMGFEVKKSQIMLAKPIKEVGEFPIKIMLDHNLESEIKVVVNGEVESKEDEE
jgi:large subunit ribosomal protein L9